MKTDASSSNVEEREQWRARIQRALAELRNDHERIAPGGAPAQEARADVDAR